MIARNEIGWGFTIAQCDAEELKKPWIDQVNELVAVGSSKFHNT